jgi:hypothetical protein
MPPTLATNDRVKSVVMNAEMCCQFAYGPFASGIHRPPLKNLACGVTRRTRPFTSRCTTRPTLRVESHSVSVSCCSVALRVPVSDVVSVCSEKEVLRLHTTRHVAPVANHHIWRDWPEGRFPHDPVGSSLARSITEGTVPIAETSGCPKPARLGLIDFVPEPAREDHSVMFPRLSIRFAVVQQAVSTGGEV